MHILVFWAAALALLPLGLGIALQALSPSRSVVPPGKRSSSSGSSPVAIVGEA